MPNPSPASTCVDLNRVQRDEPRAAAAALEASWHPSYWPTLRFDTAEQNALRAACLESGRGYFDGTETIGRREQ